MSDRATACFVDVCNYQPSPRSNHPADVVRERDIAISWLLGELDKATEEIQKRERLIGLLIAEGSTPDRG